MSRNCAEGIFVSFLTKVNLGEVRLPEGRKLSSVMGIILPFFLQAVKLTSSRTQLPYEYYSLPFCQPTKITYKAENLGMYPPNSMLPSTNLLLMS